MYICWSGSPEWLARGCDFLFWYILHSIQFTPRKLRAEQKKRAETPVRGQKTRGYIQGEDPAAAGIRSFFSLPYLETRNIGKFAL